MANPTGFFKEDGKTKPLHARRNKRTHSALSREEAKVINARRSARARSIDSSLRAKQTTTEEWKKQPNRLDYPGIDTPGTKQEASPIPKSEAVNDNKPYITGPRKFIHNKKETTARQLIGYDSMNNSYEQDNYPYGGKRTKIRHWIETRPGYGQRWMSQTMDPKTGKWNKPKGSVYNEVVLLKLVKQPDGRDFVMRDDPRYYISEENRYATRADIKQWIDHNDLTEYQIKAINREMKYRGVKD